MAKVRALVEGGALNWASNQSAMLALEGLENATGNLREPNAAEPAALALTQIRQSARHLIDAESHAKSPEREAVKAAERATRDVVVWRCLCRSNPRDRKDFLATLTAAFGRTLDDDLKAQLLLSHRKIASSVIESFPSNGQRATLWWGAPRPRRKRDGPAGATEATGEADSDAGEPEATFHWRSPPWQDASAASSSSAATTLPDSHCTPFTEQEALVIQNTYFNNEMPWGHSPQGAFFCYLQDPASLETHGATHPMDRSSAAFWPAPGLEAIPEAMEVTEAVGEADEWLPDKVIMMLNELMDEMEWHFPEEENI